MKKIIAILEDINPDVDYMTCNALIDNQVLDSFAILSIVAELQEEFDIYVTPMDIKPANFNSAQALWMMVLRLKA
ncbi:MAG TPA: acyl carrier protein [Bacillota bacterium]|nr:acyl carrier protein [Bacillota bacterium]